MHSVPHSADRDTNFGFSITRWHARAQTLARLAAMFAILGACAPAPERGPVQVPAEIAELATDALRAASEVKVRGDVATVLRNHPLSPRYADAMRKHVTLMSELHRVGLQSHIRYPRYELNVRHDQFCSDGAVAHLVVTTRVRYDMEPVPPSSGTPPYTASEEEHAFRFARGTDGDWTMAWHDEIDLAERHQHETATRLRNPCAGAQ